MGVSYTQKYEIACLVRNRKSTSRLDISKIIGIALPTVSTLVRDLIRRGVICEDGYGKSAGGRKPAHLKLNADYAGAIGVQLSAQRIAGMTVDMVGTPKNSETRPNPESYDRETILDTVFGIIEKLVSENRNLPLRGVGVGISGFIDEQGRVSRELPLAEEWSDVPLADMIEERFGLPTELLNAVHASTLGECRFAKIEGGRNMLFLHMGRGVAVGLIADGRLHQGATKNAGEFGHSVLREDGPICHCGNRGCLESFASASAIVAQCREAIAKGVRSSISNGNGDTEDLTLADVLKAAEQGDRLADNVVREAGHYLGGALANLVNTLNPEVLMFGGVLAQGPNALTRSIEQSYKGRVLPLLREKTRVEVSRLGEDACALGAAARIFDGMFRSADALFASSEEGVLAKG